MIYDPIKHTCMNAGIVCHTSCATCNGAYSDECLTCSGSLYYHSSLSTCTASCRFDEYILGNTCYPCHTLCATCDGGDNDDCLTCSDPLYYHSS